MGLQDFFPVLLVYITYVMHSEKNPNVDCHMLHNAYGYYTE